MFLLLAVEAAGAPVAHEPGWSVTPFALVPDSYYAADSPEVDGAGNLYVCAAPVGIYRFDPSGAANLWSTGGGNGLAMLPSGEAYLPSRDVTATKYVWHILPDGSFTPLSATPSPSWTWAALAADGTLYLNVWAGVGEGLYRMDRLTGVATPLVSGGPGPSGQGWYWDMATLLDGTLFVSGWSGTGNAIFRYAGSSLVQVASLSSAVIGLCRGPAGSLFGAGFDGSGGSVWRIDPSTGVVSLFASGFGQTVGVAYDPTHERIYVVDQQSPRQVWVITTLPTTTARSSWGGVKAKYR